MMWCQAPPGRQQGLVGNMVGSQVSKSTHNTRAACSGVGKLRHSPAIQGTHGLQGEKTCQGWCHQQSHQHHLVSSHAQPAHKLGSPARNDLWQCGSWGPGTSVNTRSCVHGLSSPQLYPQPQGKPLPLMLWSSPATTQQGPSAPGQPLPLTQWGSPRQRSPLMVPLESKVTSVHYAMVSPSSRVTSMPHIMGNSSLGATSGLHHHGISQP